MFGTLQVPYGIDFAALNGSQTLFGTERAYLRHHGGDADMYDGSYMREWYMSEAASWARVGRTQERAPRRAPREYSYHAGTAPSRASACPTYGQGTSSYTLMTRSWGSTS